jgi:hypothetical protein
MACKRREFGGWSLLVSKLVNENRRRTSFDFRDAEFVNDRQTDETVISWWLCNLLVSFKDEEENIPCKRL